MKKPNQLIVSDKPERFPKDSWNKNKFFTKLVIKKDNPLQNDGITKLKDVMDGLPSGIVFKDETGMGATHVELYSKRNSIIVEPIRITASSKASKSKEFLYVGSPTKTYHPNKISDKHIQDYLINPNIEFKKIVVVADSLWRVIGAILNINPIKGVDSKIQFIKGIGSGGAKESILERLENIKKYKILRKANDLSVINDYFLLIDEIDSFQLDSTFRRSMEDCLDYYKFFKEDMRCMLSATDIKFSDPDLQEEPQTNIAYDSPSKRKIDIITSGSKHLLGKAFDRIKGTLIKYPDDKILVAYNSVNGCYSLAENLKRRKLITGGSIAILCSNQSEDKAGGYFKELDSDKLPARVNFITSAYFTGFDLHERFHLISISGNRSNTQALSERRLKQIAGRCRNGLLSETIIHDYIMGETFEYTESEFTTEEELYKLFDLPKKDIRKRIKQEKTPTPKKERIIKKNPTKDELIEAASEQVRSLNCMNKHYKRNKILHEILDDVNDKFLRLLDEKQMRYVRKGRNNNFKISYLNIDAKLESLRVRKELYLVAYALNDELQRAGHNVNSIEILKTTKVWDFKISSEEKDDQIRQVIKMLKEIKEPSEIDGYLESRELNHFQKSIVRDYKKFYGYLEFESILDKMEQCLICQRDNRRYNSLLISAQIQTLPDGHIIIDRLKYYFGIGKKYSPQDILKRMTLFLLETGNTKKIKDEREAIKMLNNFRQTYRKIDKGDKTIYYHIKNDNPFNIEFKSKRLPLEQIQIEN